VSAQDLNLNKPVRYRKPRADVYTLLLGIALVALILACVFAFLEVSDYGDQPFSGAPSVSAAMPLEQPGNAGARRPETATAFAAAGAGAPSSAAV
jgi:hypothetical protein